MKTKFACLTLSVALIGSINFAAFGQVQYSLEDCKQKALVNNKKIRASDYEIKASQSLHRSVAANALPKVEGTVTAAHIGSPLGGAFNGLIPEQFANGSITILQPIYAGGKIRYGTQLAAKSVQLQEEQKNITSADLLVDVEKAYWQVVQVSEKIILALQFREMLDVLHQDLQNSFDAGMIYKNDLLRVEVRLNEAELSITKAYDGMIMAKLNLAQLIGEPDNMDFSLSDTVTGDFLPLQKLMANSADNRPEVRMLRTGIDAEILQRKILRAEQMPSLGVSLTGLAVTGQRVNVETGEDHMTSYYALANLSIPIFEWGKRANRVREQSFKIAAQQQRLDETIQMIDLEVQNAYLLLNQAAKNVELSMLSVRQAAENLKLANDRFKAGTIVGKDVEEAQVLWEQAYSSLIDAKVQYKIQEVLYRKSIGDLKG